MRTTKMLRRYERAYRQPSSEELLKLMENARRERSMAIAGFLGLGRGRPKPDQDHSAAAPDTAAAFGAVA